MWNIILSLDVIQQRRENGKSIDYLAEVLHLGMSTKVYSNNEDGEELLSFSLTAVNSFNLYRGRPALDWMSSSRNF